MFGCLAFAAATSVQSSDKLSARGIPCIFLGYPPFQKGFRLLNLIDNSILVSIDVIFHEDIFPLNTYKSIASAYMLPIPASLTNS